jgi:hypothetical protein
MALFGRESERDQARAAGYAAWFARQHPLALPSVLLSAFSLSHMGVLLLDELAGIAFGVVALSQIRRARQSPADESTLTRTEGQWLAVAGVVVGVVSLVLAVVIYSTRPHR